MARILVVCSANVCRSPLAEQLLQARLSTIPGFDRLVCSSAGIEVSRGHEMCADAAAVLGLPSEGPKAPAHRARRVTKSMIGGAGLVLTASRAERSALARLSPEARSKVFTLREAAALAEAPDQAIATWRPGAGTTADQRLSDLAALLNARRGLAPAPKPERTGLFARFGSDVDPLDIADGHNLGKRAHRTTLRSVQRSVERFGAAVEALTR
ncbi:arsenate reductase/protein-tyrosine-phosphatase family protein [Plantibacter sp. CFBP 8804]|uniref:arsenate reductase/protein-tyrosine-phosphatase family protein n=1 Tax=Plantibacter sp. CFBP 8804 TaxID=2775270 RepID=UPI00177E1048|nr:hypothetical protein [Plantibacter sp. CFBP 8804]MBD8517053.1 hypothetical protein [Plantibacter sp. CFBP 8804]